MASESSQSSSPSPGDTFIGSFISLISKSEIRYEGILYHLNVHDSTLGLKDVRSCGTEGRNKDGPQVPSCDTVYDYILFRGSDIKDLQVNPSPSAQSKPKIQSEKDINQSSHSRPAMSSPPTGYDSGYGLGRGAQWVHTPALTSKPVPTTQHSPVPLGFQPPPANGGSLTESPASLIDSTNTFQATQNNAGLSMPVPSFVQGNKVASTGVPLSMKQQAVSSSTKKNDQAQIVDMFASPIMGLVDDTTKVVTHTQDVASNLSYSSNPSPLGQAQHHTPPGLASSPSKFSPLSEAQLSAPHTHTSQAVGKCLYDSQSKHYNQSARYSSPAVTSDSAPVIPGPSSNSPQSFIGMEPLMQSRQHMVDRGQEGVPSRSLATTYQAPLLPLSVSSNQTRIPSSSIEFTEEFDFEAMNGKFNKSELWGFLGKNNQTNHREETAVESSEEGKAKPAYKKDDFFDTISCNRLDGAARSGQQQQHIQFPEHMRQNPQGFGNHFQRPLQPQPGQGAYLAAQTYYRGGYNNNYSNSGYGYYSSGRGRGSNTNF